MAKMNGMGLQFDKPFDEQTEELIFGSVNYTPNATAVIQASGDKVKTQVDSIIEFSEWLKNYAPEVYSAAVQSRPEIFMPEFALSGLRGLSGGCCLLSGLRGLFDATDTAPTTDWGKMASDILGSLVGIYSQKQLININIKRAEQGYPPLTDTSAFSPSVNVNLPIETQKQIGDIGKVIVVGLLGLGALMLINSRGKGR